MSLVQSSGITCTMHSSIWISSATQWQCMWQCISILKIHLFIYLFVNEAARYDNLIFNTKLALQRWQEYEVTTYHARCCQTEDRLGGLLAVWGDEHMKVKINARSLSNNDDRHISSHLLKLSFFVSGCSYISEGYISLRWIHIPQIANYECRLSCLREAKYHLGFVSCIQSIQLRICVTVFI